MAPIAYLFKIVVDFQSPLSEAEILTRFTDNVVPDLDTKISQRLNAHIDGLTTERKTKLHSFDNPLAGFQFYPKAVISGDANKTDDFIEARIDQAYDDMKVIIETDIEAQGGNILKWHTHLTSGTVDEVL